MDVSRYVTMSVSEGSIEGSTHGMLPDVNVHRLSAEIYSPFYRHMIINGIEHPYTLECNARYIPASLVLHTPSG